MTVPCPPIMCRRVSRNGWAWLLKPVLSVLMSLQPALMLAANAVPTSSPASSSPPALTRSLNAAGLELRLGPVLLHFNSGALFLDGTPQTPVIRGTFVGRGTATFVPKGPLEQRQLMVFTGYPGLLEAFSSAVIVVGPGPLRTAIDALASADAPQPVRSKADALWSAWQHAPERRILGVEGLALRGNHDDPLADGAVSLLLDGDTLGRFVVAIDPGDEEPLTIGQFQPWDLKRSMRKKVDKLIQKGFRRHWFEAEAILKGTWNTWISTVLDGSVPVDSSGIAPFDVPRMALDVTLKGSKLQMSTTARVELRASRNGLRVVKLGIPTSLVDLKITGPGGEELPFIRTPINVFALLPAPVSRGEDTFIDVAYHLKAMEHPGRKAYAMADPTGWLPWVVGAKPELYDMTVHWPKKLQLFAPGIVIKAEQVSKGVRSRTVELRPGSSGLTFAIGDYDTRHDTIDGQEIVVAADRTARSYKGSAADQLLAAVREIVTALRGPFGPLPFGKLTVVTGHQGLSMSFPGFILLSSLTVVDRGALQDAMGIYGTPEGNLAHEIAHQWLGNAVDAASYRDTWWVEGGANFVAERVMFARAAAQGRRPATGLFPRRRLSTTLLLSDGLDRHTMSPPPLGSRLLTSVTGYATYISTLYDWGSQIFFLLDDTAPSRDLLTAMGKVIQRHSGHSLSAKTLLREIGAALNLNAERITAPFLDGSPPPVVVFRFSPASASGERWQITGRAHVSALITTSTVALSGTLQAPGIEFRHRWHVQTIRPPLGIPFGVFAKTSRKDSVVRKFGTFTGRWTSIFALYRPETASYGIMLLEKPSLRFRVQASFLPSDLRLDPDAQLPVVTVSLNHTPAFARLSAGLEQAAAGKMDRAADWFRNVTGLCEHLDRSASSKADLEAECVIADMAAHVHLGILALSKGDTGAAERNLVFARNSLAHGKKLLEGEEIPESPSLLALEARIGLAEGKAETARAILSARATEQHKPLTADGYAVLAVAAKLSGHPDEAAHAWQAAKIFGLTPAAGAATTLGH